MRNVALIGKARAGKDTVAQHLVANYGYKRVAFADPLKEMALKADPGIADYEWEDGRPFQLSDAVSLYGWEHVKDNYPEARRILQDLGSAVREVLGEDTWLQRGLSTASYAMLGGSPVVFTDVRYRNEASALRNAGFTMVRIERPSLGSSDGHQSETELDDYAADAVLDNDRDVSWLLGAVDGLVAATR